MTPEAIYKAVRDILIVGAIAFIVYRIYVDGKNAVTVKQVAQLQKQIEQQAVTTQQWRSKADNANTNLAASLDRIRSDPVVVHDWVQSQPNCPGLKVLSTPTFKTSDSAADRGSILAVPGESADNSRLRDTAVADFKREWEGRLAGYRVLYDSWPQP